MSDVGPREVVTVIDDDHAVRESLRFLLEVAGHAVEAFASAVAFLDAEMHDVACLIKDHQMPVMTGLNLVELLRARGVRVPVLLITGDPSHEIIGRAKRLGVERAVGKPAGEQNLLDFIAASISRDDLSPC
jgi:two-component system response regulator FixJ